MSREPANRAVIASGPALNAAAATNARPAGRWQARYDLGTLNLSGLSAAKRAAPAADAVQPVTYQETVPVAASRGNANGNSRISISVGVSIGISIWKFC